MHPVRTSDPEPFVLQRLLVSMVPLLILGAFSWALRKEGVIDAALVTGLALAALAYLAAFYDLTLGLAILILCSGISPEFSLAGFNDLRLSDFVVPALLASWMLRSVEQREPLVPTGLGAPLALAVAVSLLSTLLGTATGTTTLFYAARILAKQAEYLLILVLFANAVRRPGEFRALAIFTLLSAVASLAYSHQEVATIDGEGRLGGPDGETANIFGGFLAMHLALALGLFLGTQDRGARLGFAAVIVFITGILLSTLSRTSLVAIGAGSLLFAVLKDRRLLTLLAIFAALLPVLAPATVWNRVESIFGTAVGAGPSSWLARVEAWEKHVPRVLGENPVLGFGTGSIAFGEIDNEYVRILVDNGLLGLAAFLWILFRMASHANRLTRELPEGTFERSFASGYWIALWTLIVHAVGCTSFTAIRTMESFMVLTGLFLALSWRRAEWLPGSDPGAGVVLLDRSPVLDPWR
jgi:hypothetical protein